MASGFGAAIRILTLVGAILAIGGVATQGWLTAARPARGHLRRATVAGAVCMVLGTLLQFARILSSLSGGDFAIAASISRILVTSPTGMLLGARILLAVVLCLRQAWRREIASQEATLWALALALSLAGDSHAADLVGIYRAVALAADSAHILLAASWLGGLIMLVTIHRQVENAKELVRQFSRIATFVIPGLVLAGLVNVYLHLPRAGVLGLLGFAWGRLVLVKIAVVTGIVVLAAASRRQTALLAEPNWSGALLRRIAGEVVLGLLVLGLSGLLSQSDPMPPLPAGGGMSGLASPDSELAQAVDRLSTDSGLRDEVVTNLAVD
ncbi:MAG: CopD family protein, partial [Cyanobacteria bacterium REEB65]|nr:CopD family protein [Cyanobacteria bacterium REEB65]